MPTRRLASQDPLRCLGIGVLILSLGHTPLPMADFHNIRHHDGPGEICRYHDHLLQWHPDAKQADDVAVLHWHWFLPATPGLPGSHPDEQAPGLHARVPDWSGLTWDDAPQLSPDARGRFIGRPELRPFTLPPPRCDAVSSVFLVRAGPRPIHTFSATFAPRVPLLSLLQRWVC